MKSIYKYIQKLNPVIIDKFENRKNDKFNLVLYGAGEKGKSFFNENDLSNIQVMYYCDDDNNKWGKYLNGVKIISPRELCDVSLDIPVIITSRCCDEIYERLSKLGIKHILHRFALNYLFNVDKLQKVYELLYDQLSKDVFLGLLKYVFTQNPDVFKEITSSEEQYFIDDIFTFNGSECIIDGGAYIGDTIKSYLDVCEGKYEKIYSFEPDNVNYAKLSNMVLKLGDIAKNIETFNLGLYSKSGKVYFSNNHSSDSCIVESSAYYIDVTSIDDKFKNRKITMIKLDIEGAEVDAILGAEQVLKEQKPKLAICNYHLPSDLWEIILLILDFVPNYKIFMRHHDIRCWYETVIYAKIQD